MDRSEQRPTARTGRGDVRRSSASDAGDGVRPVPAERPWFCHGCGTAARGRWVPAGWYAVSRATGGAGAHLRLGLFCSVTCLADPGVALLAEGERVHADRLGLPAETARDRARVVELATTYLHRGWSVRQAGDVLDVQTPVLTKWLREAGVHVTRGTLTGEPPTGPTGPSASTSTPAPAPDPGATVADAAARVAAGAHPVSVLNELVQAGALEALTWAVEAVKRPGADLVHTARVATRLVGTDVELVGEGTAPAKAGARAAAAVDVLGFVSGGPLTTA